VDSNESLWTQNITKTSQVRLRKTLRIPYTIFDTPLDFHLVSHRTGMLHRNTVAFTRSRYRYSVNHFRVWISTQHETQKIFDGGMTQVYCVKFNLNDEFKFCRPRQNRSQGETT
jgi:hypothetical protein